MSNKLYTEEQVRTIIGIAHMLYCDDEFLFSEDYLISSEQPIELPSDEDIHIHAKDYSSNYYEFRAGAKWMRDKIQGGKDEQ